MSSADDQAYYAVRAVAERRLAATSQDPVAAKLHMTLAEAYELRLSSPGPGAAQSPRTDQTETVDMGRP